MCHAHLTSVGFEHYVCHQSRLTCFIFVFYIEDSISARVNKCKYDIYSNCKKKIAKLLVIKLIVIKCLF